MQTSERQLTAFLMKNEQQLLPVVQLIEQSRLAIDELVDKIGLVTIGPVLEMSAEQVVGPRQQGKGRQVGSWSGMENNLGRLL